MALPAGNAKAIDVNLQKWKLHGKGKQTIIGDNDVQFSVYACSEGFSYWLSPALQLQPKSIYKLTFQVLALQKGGSAQVGLTSYNKSLGWWTPHKWTSYMIIFATPDKIIPERSSLRFGQYGMKGGKIIYRNIHLLQVKPEYKKFDSIELGNGEIIYDNCYQFITRFLIHGNHSRPLKAFQCAFNSNRWVFFKNDYVIYEHILDKLTQTSGRIELHIDWRNEGKLIVEASSKKLQDKWIYIGQVDRTGDIGMKIPSRLYPASNIKIRLRNVSNHPFKGDFDPGTIQVGVYRYFAKINKVFTKILKGKTTYKEK